MNNTKKKDITATPRQQEVLDHLHSFVKKKGEEMFLVIGYAGTGKTFLISQFVKEILKKNLTASFFSRKKIAITAPTNKAVKVLMKQSAFAPEEVRFSTVHSILGLKEEIDAYGKVKFNNDRYNTCQVGEYDIIIIDEASMLDDNLFEKLIAYRDTVKLIFLGDSAQIPPVNHNYSAIMQKEIIEKYDVIVEELNEIIRQKEDSPILDIATFVRQNLKIENGLNLEKFKKINDNGEGVHLLSFSNEKEKESIKKILKDFFDSEEFKKDPDYVKVISYKNLVVDSFNSSIRKILFGDDIAKIEIGERLIADKPILTSKNSTIFNTNDEFEVIDFKISHIKRNKKKFKIYKTKVKFFDVYINDYVNKEINILHEDDQSKFEKESERLSGLAKQCFAGSEEARMAWSKYYRFLKSFANVKYSYAITAHKSQGSTYENCIVFMDDIDSNFNVLERNKIKYTSFTRPRKNLYIISNNII